MLADRLFVRFRRYSQVALGIAGRILCLAPGTLDFALYLLNGAFYLCACVAGQVADLTLGASYYLVDGAFHSVLVHLFTSQRMVAHTPGRPQYQKEHKRCLKLAFRTQKIGRASCR